MSELKKYKVTAYRSECVVVEAEDPDSAHAMAESELWDLMGGAWHDTEIEEADE